VTTAKEEKQALQESLITLKECNDQAQTQVLQMQEELKDKESTAQAGSSSTETLQGQLQEAVAEVHHD